MRNHVQHAIYREQALVLTLAKKRAYLPPTNFDIRIEMAAITHCLLCANSQQNKGPALSRAFVLLMC